MKQRTALAWVPELPTYETRTFWGGYPIWPKDEPWPSQGDKECLFLAQFDLADLPWRPKGVPDSGTLYLFYDPTTEINYSKPADLRSVYFASAGRDCVETLPSQKLTQDKSLIYAGGLGSGIGPDRIIWADYDRLPKFGLRLVPFQDCWHGWNNGTYHPAPQNRLMHADWETAHNQRTANLDQLFESIGFTRPTHESDRAWQRSCADIIDPEHLRMEIPRLGAPKEIDQDPRAADWPITSANILFHAVGILNENVTRRDTDLDQDSIAFTIMQEAKDWATWARKTDERLLSTLARARYRDWCRAAFLRAIKQLKRITPFTLSPDNKIPDDLSMPLIFKGGQRALLAGTDRRREYGALFHIVRSMFQFHPYHSDFGLLDLEVDELSALPDWAKQKYLTLYPPGQLFGYGHDQHSDIFSYQDYFFLADIHSGGGVDCVDVFKMWLAEPIQPDCWQKVIIVNQA